MSLLGSRSFANVAATLVCVALGAAVSVPAASAGSALPAGAYVMHSGEGTFTGIDCVSASRCYTTDGSEVRRFDPTRLDQGAKKVKDGLVGMFELACPALAQCVVRGGYGRQTLTTSTAQISPVIDLGIQPYGIPPSCPTTTQCTAIDSYKGIATFDPTSNATGQVGTTPGTVNAISCPSTTLCVAAGVDILVFDPAAPDAAVRTAFDPSGTNAVDCPTTTQCTAIGKNFQLTFDPRSPGAAQPVRITEFDHSLSFSFSCPTVRQCVAIEMPRETDTMTALGFDPTTSKPPVRTELFLGGRLSCASARQCTIAGGDGSMKTSYAVAQTFDPTGRSLDAETARRVTLSESTKVVVVGTTAKSAVGRSVTTTLSRRFKDDVVLRSRVQRPGRFSAAFGELKSGTYTARSVLGGKTIKTTTIVIPDS